MRPNVQVIPIQQITIYVGIKMTSGSLRLIKRKWNLHLFIYYSLTGKQKSEIVNKQLT